MRNLDAHFSCQDASLVLQCFYGLHVCGQYIACYYTEHIHSTSRCDFRRVIDNNNNNIG